MSRFATDLGRVADDLPNALVMIQADGTVSWTNQAAVDLLDLAPNAWRGEALLGLVHDDDHAAAVTALDSVRSKAPAPRAEVRIRDGAGEWRRSGFRGRAFPAGAHGEEFVVAVIS